MQVISDNHVVLGSLPSGSCSLPLSFTLRVDRNAPAGVYELPMTVTYKYMTDNAAYYSAYGQFMAYNNYVEEVVTVNLIVVVKDMFDLVVSDIWSDNMVPGSEGVIIMKIKNIGSLDVDESVAYLQSSTIGPPQDISNLGYGPLSSPATVDQSMLIPIQNSQFLGRMMAGEEKIVKFKVGISPDAGDGLYPLSVVVSYVDPWGVQMSSNVRTFGVPVEPEMIFSVDAAPIEIKCGKNCVADLTLFNNGTLPAKDAIVRMNALDPFTVGYDTAYLGDIGPGENASTKFSIKVKDDAVPNTYYVTLEVKYYDSNDDPHVTSIIRKPVVVEPPPTLLETLLENWPLIAGLAIAVILALAYFARKLRKNNKANEGK
ncbi:hypothetical protein CUJ83_13020 [Methanocella sp. CWC-04]|uniref:Uncharacterized protein n=2 Tax=Methanooceanicella nereidis TaxID=2052831 RepID=A0AAP2W720_9EURY|nr:hypothetical protein [Methanocella sp. CWC-04]